MTVSRPQSVCSFSSPYVPGGHWQALPERLQNRTTTTLLNTKKNHDFQMKIAGPSPEAITQTQHDLEKDG